MQHFSNYVVQILVIRSKCWGGGGKKMARGGGKKNSKGAIAPLLAPMQYIMYLLWKFFCIILM